MLHRQFSWKVLCCAARPFLNPVLHFLLSCCFVYVCVCVCVSFFCVSCVCICVYLGVRVFSYVCVLCVLGSLAFGSGIWDVGSEV